MRRICATTLLLLHVGCATITGSSSSVLHVQASPSGAEVSLNGFGHGAVPMSIDIPKQNRSLVEVTAPGYRKASCSTSMSANAGYVAADIALCVLLFPIGCISFIDAAGAWRELDVPECQVTLAKDAS